MSEILKELEKILNNKKTLKNIDDVLKDYAKKNFLSLQNKKITIATKEDVDKAIEDNLSFDAIEYMAKSENKHNKKKNKKSIYDINKDDLDYIAKKRMEFIENAIKNKPTEENKNEFNIISSIDESDLYLKLKEIKKELSPVDVSKAYALSRLGFEFKSLFPYNPKEALKSGGSQNLIKKGDPVKVVVYKYTVLPASIADFIKNDIIKELKERLDLEDFLEWLENFELSDDLDKIRLEVYSKVKELLDIVKNPVMLDKKMLKDNVIVKGFLGQFIKAIPKEYQYKIIDALIDDEYRKFIGIKGLQKNEAVRTTYQGGEFLMMNDYHPFVTIKIIPSKNKDIQNYIFEKFAENEKDHYTFDEIKEFVEKNKIPYKIEKTHEFINEIQLTNPYNNKVIYITVESEMNENYKPYIHNVEPEKWEIDELREKVLKEMYGNIKSVLSKDIKNIKKHQEDIEKYLDYDDEYVELKEFDKFTPIAYKYIINDEGEEEMIPVTLYDLKDKKIDLTNIYENKNLGLHFVHDAKDIIEKYIERLNELEGKKASYNKLFFNKIASYINSIFMDEDGNVYNSQKEMEEESYKKLEKDLKEHVKQILKDKLLEHINSYDYNFEVQIKSPREFMQKFKTKEEKEKEQKQLVALIKQLVEMLYG